MQLFDWFDWLQKGSFVLKVLWLCEEASEMLTVLRLQLGHWQQQHLLTY